MNDRPIADAIKRIDNKLMKAFYEAGSAFIQAGKFGGKDPAFGIEPGTQEWARWMAYFAELGREPVQMAMARKGQTRSATMPAQWPEWFDTSWAAGRAKPLQAQIDPAPARGAAA
jgi:hypothetical protein